MKTKLCTLLFAIGAGITSFVSWLETVPPEDQSGWLDTLVELTPVQYRAKVALFSRFATLFAGIYVTYRATHSKQTNP